MGAAFEDKRFDLDFGGALQLLRSGCKVSRRGWNGNSETQAPRGTQINLYLILVQGSEFAVNRAPLNEHYAEGTPVQYGAHIDLVDTRGDKPLVQTWSPSNSDALAEDWQAV